MLCKDCGKKGPEQYISLLYCKICALKYRVERYFQAVYTSTLSLDLGKYILKSKDEICKLNKDLGFSSRKNRNHTLGIYNEIDETNFRNSYVLLASYLESVFNLICSSHELIKTTYHDIPQIQIDPEKYVAHIFSSSKEPDLFLFKENELRQPVFWKVARFVHLVSNTLKHTDGVIKNKQSGKILIEGYGLVEGRSIFSYRGAILPEDTSGINIGEVSKLTAMLLIYSKDLLAILFNAPQLSPPQVNLDKNIEEIREVDL